MFGSSNTLCTTEIAHIINLLQHPHRVSSAVESYNALITLRFFQKGTHIGNNASYCYYIKLTFFQLLQFQSVSFIKF